MILSIAETRNSPCTTIPEKRLLNSILLLRIYSKLIKQILLPNTSRSQTWWLWNRSPISSTILICKQRSHSAFQARFLRLWVRILKTNKSNLLTQFMKKMKSWKKLQKMSLSRHYKSRRVAVEQILLSKRFLIKEILFKRTDITCISKRKVISTHT